jgi:hypothetical protein
MKQALLLLLSLLVLSLGFPTGPGACGGPNGFTALDGVTNSPHGIPLANPNFWVITGVPKTYTPGKKYTISLDGNGAPAITDANGCAENAIAGFLVIAKDQNGIGQGTFDSNTYTQQISCGAKAGVVSASLNETKPANVKFSGVTGGVAAGHTLSFNQNLTPTVWAVNWTAPATAVGPLNFTGAAIIDPITSFILVPSVSEPPTTTTAATTAKTKTSAAQTSAVQTSAAQTSAVQTSAVQTSAAQVSTDTNLATSNAIVTFDTNSASVNLPTFFYSFATSANRVGGAGSLAPFGFVVLFGLFLAAVRW